MPRDDHVQYGQHGQRHQEEHRNGAHKEQHGPHSGRLCAAHRNQRAVHVLLPVVVRQSQHRATEQKNKRNAPRASRHARYKLQFVKNQKVHQSINTPKGNGRQIVPKRNVFLFVLNESETKIFLLCLSHENYGNLHFSHLQRTD